MTFEEYIRSQYAPKIGRIDFSFRAHVTDDTVEIYVHPAGQAGDTTPLLVVKGNTVEPKVPS